MQRDITSSNISRLQAKQSAVDTRPSKSAYAEATMQRLEKHNPKSITRADVDAATEGLYARLDQIDNSKLSEPEKLKAKKQALAKYNSALGIKDPEANQSRNSYFNSDSFSSTLDDLHSYDSFGFDENGFNRYGETKEEVEKRKKFEKLQRLLLTSSSSSSMMGALKSAGFEVDDPEIQKYKAYVADIAKTEGAKDAKATMNSLGSDFNFTDSSLAYGIADKEREAKFKRFADEHQRMGGKSYATRNELPGDLLRRIDTV